MSGSIAASVAAIKAPSAPLGLRTGEVRIVEHSPDWPVLAQHLVASLSAELEPGDVRIEHVGSTSVPGLAAKPVLDLVVGVGDPAEINTLASHLKRLGFTYVADMGSYGGLLFTLESDPNIVVTHLHVVETDGFQWRRYLAFREGLRADAELRASYELLKVNAAAEHDTDRAAYTAAKVEWVLEALTRLDANKT